MVALVVRQVHLEQLHVLVDGVDQPHLAGQQVDRPDPAAPDRAGAVGHVVVDVAGREHRLVAGAELAGAEPFGDPPLASQPLLSCSVIHSKRLLAKTGQRVLQRSEYPKSTAFRVFYCAMFADAGEITLDRGLMDLGGIGAGASGINDRGQIVGTSNGHPFFYSAGAMMDLGVTGTANGINNHGDVVGQYLTPASQNARSVQSAFRYSGGVVKNLFPFLLNFSAATAINDAGDVTGSAQTTDGIHAFLYSGGGLRDLGTLGGPHSEANAINSAAFVVGNASTSTTTHAFLYSNGMMQDLNDLIPANSGWTLSDARGINASNQIVGYGLDPQGGGQAFPLTRVIPGDANYDGSVGFDDLLVLAQHYGATAATFDQGDFNADGKVGFDDLLLLAQNYGSGSSATGEFAGAPVPEPVALNATAIALIMLLSHRRRCC